MKVQHTAQVLVQPDRWSKLLQPCRICRTISSVRYYFELHRICSIGPDLSRGREVAPARAFNRGMFCCWLVPHLSFHKYNGRESGLVITQHNSLHSSGLYNWGSILGKAGGVGGNITTWNSLISSLISWWIYLTYVLS